MKKRSLQEEIENIVLPVFVTVIIFVLCGILFDCYYDLNDDMVIKDILAGSYTGVPDGHTNQLLYPLGFLLSKIYLLFSEVPVFGIFLSGCFAVSFVLLGYRSLSYYTNHKVKLAVIFLEGVLFFSVYLWEIVYIQYSVVSGLLAAVACFWFYTIPNGLGIKDFWKQGMPALILVWIAFLVRSEMLLLMCPFLAVVGLIHWKREIKLQMETDQGPEKVKFKEKMFCKENVLRYVLFVAVLAAGLVACFGLDYVAYGSSEWKEFRQFFEARTEVYDYTWYPEYDSQTAFYEEHGITKEQYQLINSYNFGLDSAIDTNTLKSIAEFGERQRILGSFGVRIRNLIWELIHTMISLEHSPYNYVVLLSYVLVTGLAAVQKRKDYIWDLVLLVGMRTISWSYLIWSARVVDRIAHPLYMTEFLILLAILVSELYERPLWNVEKYYRRGTAIVYLAFVVLALPYGYQNVKEEQQRRNEILVNQELLDDYCKEHGENYYYLDVYSTVSFVEKIYKNVDNSRKNYDLAGGWICNSPLQKEAGSAYRVSKDEEEKEYRIETALLEDNFYFVVESIGDTQFLTDYYASKGKEISLQLQDTVGEGENPFLVYKLTEETKKSKKK